VWGNPAIGLPHHFSHILSFLFDENPSCRYLKCYQGSVIMHSIGHAAISEGLWRIKDGALPLGSRSLIMGILNVTPDSFSDGGKWLEPEDAVSQGRRMAEAGADIIDVGGESTRPGAEVIAPQEECRRIQPVVQALAADGLLVSVDTRKAAVAQAAVEAGAVVVNDVSGGHYDPDILSVVERSGAGLVLMHMRGTPSTMRDLANYENLLGEVAAELEASVGKAKEAGIGKQSIVIDPGIGFAKNPDQSFALLAGTGELTRLGYPLLIGASRKSFLGAIGIDDPRERDVATTATAVAARLWGAAIFRVHNVALVRQALDVADRILEVKTT
jgi:dihydropteroate synthase